MYNGVRTKKKNYFFLFEDMSLAYYSAKDQ